MKGEVGREEGRRNSKDRKINGDGKRLVEFLEEKGIFNGSMKVDKGGEDRGVYIY